MVRWNWAAGEIRNVQKHVLGIGVEPDCLGLVLGLTADGMMGF
jgi:hypothetical protein